MAKNRTFRKKRKVWKQKNKDFQFSKKFRQKSAIFPTF